MKSQREDIRRERASNHTRSGTTVTVVELALDQEAIARLAYFYWEARGCQNDSPEENWFRAEAELRNLLALSATG
jgi:hypothetical protein